MTETPVYSKPETVPDPEVEPVPAPEPDEVPETPEVPAEQPDEEVPA